MTDQKRISVKFKIALFIGGFFAFIFLALFILIISTTDISKEELGPSPFQIEASFVSNYNEEYDKIADIGKSIKGYDKFREEYELNLKEPEASIKLLEEYVKENEGVIEKADIELFRNCKFPKPKFEDPNLIYLRNFLNLINDRITFYILTKDFDKAKRDLVLINDLNKEIINKASGILLGMVILSSKVNELKNINLLINHGNFPIEQKIEILNIGQPNITSQFLKTISHFEIEYVQWSMQELNTPNSKELHMFSGAQYYPIFYPFFCQPNKSAKLYREMTREIITQVESSNYLSFESLNNRKNYIPEYKLFFKGNFGGKLTVEMSRPIYRLFACKILTYKSMCQQLVIAQELLLYKAKTGALPFSLTELNVEKEFLVDIQTGDPYLYSSHNGILQSLGKDKKNCKTELTMTDLTAEEIKEMLTEDLRDFILFLQ